MPQVPKPTTSTAQPEGLKEDLGPPQTATLGAYVVQPSTMHFATQSPNEPILLVLRRHPITQLLWILFAVVLTLIPPITLPFISDVFTDFGIPGTFTVVLLAFWYLATFSFILTNFVLWYFNVAIITPRRVLDIDFPSLLIQEVTGTHIQQIEDVTYQRIGVLATLFDFGNVFVQTAGTTPNIEFLQVPYPKQVVKIILDLMGTA